MSNMQGEPIVNAGDTSGSKISPTDLVRIQNLYMAHQSAREQLIAREREIMLTIELFEERYKESDLADRLDLETGNIKERRDGS